MLLVTNCLTSRFNRKFIIEARVLLIFHYLVSFPRLVVLCFIILYLTGILIDRRVDQRWWYTLSKRVKKPRVPG